ncbi:MAG: sulfatase-like hydrolase/transferase [Balneolaceae bacterium]|nr:sulfatase-like hydrolase/transferase [Balneolaceae bacterium]
MVCCFTIQGCTSADDQRDPEGPERPNIVFIISDDHAWPDYSFMGHPHIQTPNIDNLASEGLTFTRGYLAAPLCRPSLASILSGLYPHQHGVTGNDPAFDRSSVSSENIREARNPLNQVIIERYNNLPNLNTYLSEMDYLSFQTGKWWEGSWQDAGFTHGMTHGDPAHGGRHGDEGLKIGREGLQPIENFMDHAKEEDKPFFIWYAPFLPHTPHTPPDSLLEKYLPLAPNEPEAKYWAMIEWFDMTVGQLLESIENRELSDNTLVVYLADNGWIQDPDGRFFIWPSKQSPYDMGIRTPIIYKWPGHLPAEMDTTTFMSSIDLVPTVLDILNISPEKKLPGINALDREARDTREAVFSSDYNHDIADVHDPTESLEHRVVLRSPWKLILPKEEGNQTDIQGDVRSIDMIEKPALYNVVNDPYETENVAEEHAEVVSELEQLIEEWWDPEV